MKVLLLVGMMKTGIFFSEGDSSGDDNDVDDEMLPEESSLVIHESSMQPEQQLLVSL